MSNRLNQEREEHLQPKRVEAAVEVLTDLGYNVVVIDGKELQFEYKGNMVKFWPYSGWHSGKGIKDGRGLIKLLNQLKP